jgi:aquaporin related protein
VVKAGLYIIVQCVAAIVGIAVLKALTPGDTSEIGFGYTTLAKDMTELQGFGVEFMITFVLLIIIFAVTDEGRRDIKGSAPLAIGLALTALVLYGGPLTGAGMNPARVLGPCVILGKFESHWLYWVGPIGGAVTAAAVYQGVFRASRPDEIEAVDLALERKSRDREAVKINGAVPPV